MRASRLARIQHGVVATWQLRIIGFSRNQIAHDVRVGRLHRLHVGAYAVGHTRITLKGRWMAAVLAAGPEAVLSHRAAVALHAYRPAPSGPIDVTVPGHRRSRRGMRVHSVHALDPDDRTVVDGIPVTAMARTLLDYAEVAGEQQIRLALEAAQRCEELDMKPMRAMLARNQGRRGIKPLRAALSHIRTEVPWTISETERRLLAALRARGVPEPSTNVIVEDELLDMYWQKYRLNVEIDGDFWHRTPAARERARRRDIKLQLAGEMVARFGDYRINEELDAVVDEIVALIKLRSAQGP